MLRVCILSLMLPTKKTVTRITIKIPDHKLPDAHTSAENCDHPVRNSHNKQRMLCLLRKLL